MLSQAKKMQEKMREVQENLKNIEVEGIAGGNLVRVVLKGNHEMKSIYVDAKAKKEKELKEKYGMDDKKSPAPEPIQKKSKWEDMGFGKKETDKR